jgi:hypothetical protein
MHTDIMRSHPNVGLTASTEFVLINTTFRRLLQSFIGLGTAASTHSVPV